MKAKEFYEGAKARECDHLPFTDEDGAYEHAKRLCPYAEGSAGWNEWTDGYLAFCGLQEIEDFVDTTQLTYEEVEEFSRKPGEEE